MSFPPWLKSAAESLSQGVTAIAAFGAFIYGIVNRNKIQRFQITVDGKMDKLLETTASSAHAEGRREGVESEQQRMRAPDASPPPKEKQ